MSLTPSDESFQRLVLIANEAAVAPCKWSWFLKEMSSIAGGVRVQIFSHDTRTGQPLGFHTYGYDPEFLESYTSHYGEINSWIGGFSKLTPGKTAYGRELVSDEEMQKTEFYNDWVRPQEDMIGGCATILDAGSHRLSSIAASVRRADRERLETPLHDLMQRLIPHLQQALKIGSMLGDLRLENRVLWTGMDPGIAALFVLDSKGRVRFANARGDALVDRGEFVQIDRHSRLSIPDREASCELARALHDRKVHGPGISLPFFIKGPRQKQFVCRAVPLSESDGPQPWLGRNDERGRAFTLLILAPISRPIKQIPHQASAR